ncbi:MAG: hypothetical protein U0176_02865 [Bacteroidia bacterium]
MLHRQLVFTLFLLLFGGIVSAQPCCNGNYNCTYTTATTCGSTPFTISAITPCSNCSYSWAGPVVAGQGTTLATYQYTNAVPGWGQSAFYWDLTVTDNTNSCTYKELHDVGIGWQPPVSLPTLANGPWNGDTSKVWIYARSYMIGFTNGTYYFYPSWSVTGGNIVRTRHVQGGPFWNDSVLVKWTGAAPMSLNEAQLTQHAPPNLTSFNCNWTPPTTFFPNPPLNVFYNGAVCPNIAKNFFTFPYQGSTYTWSVTNGSILSGQGTNSVQISMSAPGTVTVVRDSSGTLTTASTSVTPVNPTVNLGPNQTLCQGSSLTLNAGSGYSNYLWSTGATTQTISVTNAGSYSVTATINGGCQASDTVVITSLPTNPVNLGPDVHTCTLPVTLNAGPGYATYVWNQGATTSTIPAVTPGQYSVTVTESNGCSTLDTVIVYDNHTTVNLGPDHTICVPGLTNISGSTTQVTSYLWSTGATTPTIQVTGLGPQTLWLQGSNIYGCTSSDTLVLTGVPRPTPNLGPDQSVCPGTPVTFTPGPGYNSYGWSNFSTQQSITVSNPGSYWVSVTDGTGCSGRDTVQLINYPVTPVNLGPDINVCQPSTVLNAGSGYASYAWSSGATTQQITVTTTGTYSVTATTVNGCTTSDAIVVSFNPLSFTLGPDQIVCEPDVVVLDPQLTGNFTYNWSNGATTPTISLFVPGTHLIDLTVSNAFNCTAHDTVVVTIMPTPTSGLMNDTLLCRDTTITLAVSPGFSSYLWSTGATTQSITLANGGVYSLTATAPNGCIRRDTVLISDLIDCVFPGDVNYDGLVSGTDVIALGLGIGYTGAPRPNACTQWYGQWLPNWNGNIVSNVNRKQADTDGSGVITLADTNAIHLNYGSTHARVGEVTGGPAQIRLVPVTVSVMAGDPLQYDAYLEDSQGGDLDAVYGIVLNLQGVSPGIVGIRSVDMANAWFTLNSGQLPFTRRSGNDVMLALSRITGQDTMGHGWVARITYDTDPSIPSGQSVTASPVIQQNVLYSDSLAQTPLSVQAFSALVNGLSHRQDPVAYEINLAPVPASQHMMVRVTAIWTSHFQILNSLGQLVMAGQWQGGEEMDLDVATLAVGTYCIRVATEQGWLQKKFVVAR